MTRQQILNSLNLAKKFGGNDCLQKTFESLKLSVSNEDWEFLQDSYFEIYTY